MIKTLSFFFLLFAFLTSNYAQDCCDTDTKLVICYTAQFDFCNPAVCDYTFDGANMEGIRKKLDNMTNFGPNGISTCDIETKPLNNINTTGDIEALDCDVVFIGSFYTNLATITTTTLDPDFLSTIRDWSTLCDENLTILFQGETTAWGYEIANGNDNPNIAGAVTDPNIFDGPFGSLNTFNQGGSFQATFTQVPSTGITILAEDAIGRPTVVLDLFTNDILLADVGIICNDAGDVTNSPNINNNNDILACNILALGCEIAGVETSTQEKVFICQNESHTLPDGIVVDQAGEYTSTLLGSGDCDSIIVTTLDFSIPIDSLLTYVGCDQDGYSVQVGNTVYDQSNPVGSETLQNIYGCDSLVNIELIYELNSSADFDTIICRDESFNYLGVTFNTVIDTTLIIPNAQNCDSVISVSVAEFAFPDIMIDSTLIIENNISYTFQNEIPSNYSIKWDPSSGLSCDDCINPILSNVDNIPTYNMELTSIDGCIRNYPITVSYKCTPYIPNIFNPESISGNEKFTAMAPCLLEDYSLTIFDRWGSLVFQSDDQTVQWNGKLKNTESVPGVYVYTCTYTNLGISALVSGNITVLK